MKLTVRKVLFLISIAGLLVTGCNMPYKMVTKATNTPILVFPSATLDPQAIQQLTATSAPANTATVQQPPPTSALPTDTQVPPTATEVPPTPTNVPPTATRVPPTATAIPRASASAARLPNPPTIDGVWDEWSSTQYPITNVVWGRSKWSGKADLQASYRVGWDLNYLYLAVKVFDDTYAQAATGANIYLGDSIEVLLSTNPVADSAALGLIATDYQIGVSPGRPNMGENLEAYRWFPSSKAGPISAAAIGVFPMEGGYRIEFAVPWSVFGITPYKGQILGFAISVSDNDSPGENAQQTMISNAPHRALTDPTSWGVLTLK